MRRWNGRGLFVRTALAAFVVAAIALFWRAPVVATWDTVDLRVVAQESLGSAAFWLGSKPFGYPLLFKLFGRESPWLLRTQLVLHLAAWALVAWGVARRCTTAWVRGALFVVILAGSFSPGIFDWTHVYLTESLSLSLLLLPFGLVLLLVPGAPRPRWQRVVVAVVSGASLLLWIAIRDVDAAWLLMAAIATVLALVAQRAPSSLRRGALVAVAVAAALCALVSRGVDQGQRWRYPLINVIGRRVLPVPERKARWERDGMPDNERVRALAGGWAINHKLDFPGLEPWLTTRARHTYTKELLRDPAWLVGEPLAHWKELLCGNETELGNGALTLYFKPGHPARWQHFVSRTFLHNWRWLVGELVAALVLVGWAIARGGLRLDATTTPFAIVGATIVPTMILAWHGDAMEMQRHALVAMVLLRVVLWAALALAVDRAWQHWRARQRGRSQKPGASVPPTTSCAASTRDDVERSTNGAHKVS